MNSHEWHLVYRTLRMVDRGIARTMRRCPYSDVLIVAMYLWTVFHDRPMVWAANRENYHGPFRPRQRPSRSQFCRRFKTARCQELLETTLKELSAIGGMSEALATVMDSRPLRVGDYRRDPDAAQGYTKEGFVKGYKLHMLAAQRGQIQAWRVTPLNRNDQPLAHEMIAEAGVPGVLFADGAYDSNKLYDAALAKKILLLTPLPGNAGGGHRRQSYARRLAAKLWAADPREIKRERLYVERIFSQQSSFGGGLSPLPAWVRRLSRVRAWVCGKLILYAARLALRQAAA